MKKLIMVAIVFCMTVGFAYAQKDVTETKVRNQSGNTALMFTLQGLNNLGAGEYNGGAGFQIFVAENFALRTAIGVNQTSKTSYSGDDEFTNSSFKLDFAPGVRVNLANNRTVAGYVGGEILLSLTSETDEGANSETTTSMLGFGIGGFFGAEWFPWENVSISAEYGLGFTTESGTEETKNGDTQENDLPSTTKILLGRSSIDLTISFYIN